MIPGGSQPLLVTSRSQGVRPSTRGPPASHPKLVPNRRSTAKTQPIAARNHTPIHTPERCENRRRRDLGQAYVGGLHRRLPRRPRAQLASHEHMRRAEHLFRHSHIVHPRNARVRRLDERERSTRRASGEHHHHRHRLHQHPRPHPHHHPHHHPCHHPHPHPRQHHHQQRHLLLHRRRQHPPLDRLDAGCCPFIPSLECSGNPALLMRLVGVESPGRAERDLASSSRRRRLARTAR